MGTTSSSARLETAFNYELTGRGPQTSAGMRIALPAFSLALEGCLTIAPRSVTMRRMLTIRLQRVGRKNDPSFRMVVVESKRGPKSGSYLEVVGSYDARTNRTDLQGEKIKEWMNKGVTVSDTVHNLLVTKGIIEGKKRNVLPKKTVAKPAPAEAPAVEAPAAAEAPAAPAEETPAPTEAVPEAEAAPAVEDTPAETPAPEETPAA